MRFEPDLSPRGVRLRATLTGEGKPGPIEMRLGRRLIRLVDPASPEGRGLLKSGDVEMIEPGGKNLGRLRLAEARRRIHERRGTRSVTPDTP